MNMYIETNLNNFELPCVVKEDKDYYIRLKDYLSGYMNHVKNIKGISEECINNTKDNIKLILEALGYYNNAKIIKAQKNIETILKRYYDNPHIVADVDNNYAFRGMAAKPIQPEDYIEYDKYEKMNNHELSFFKARVGVNKINRKDMLHIPFDKRGLISTQRFSIPGVPCIYLSTSSLGCWLELNKPSINEFQVTSFKLPNNLKILNMCVQQHLINGATKGGYVNENQYKVITSFIEIFPLVCATSFQVLEENRKFKSEYIISQLVMQVSNDLEIDGVAYLSKKMEDFYAYPQLVNLAIIMPCKNFVQYEDNPLDVYWDRSDEIELTDTFKILDIDLESNYRIDLNDNIHCLDEKFMKKEEYLSYVNEIYKDNYHNKVEVNEKEEKYTETIFSEFDEFLLDQNFLNFRNNN